MDALTVEVREGGRTVNVHVLVAVGETPTAAVRCPTSTSPTTYPPPKPCLSSAMRPQLHRRTITALIELGNRPTAARLRDAYSERLAQAGLQPESIVTKLGHRSF
jgi:hypothetical protein